MEGNTEGFDRKVIHCIIRLLAKRNSVLPKDMLKDFANKLGIRFPFLSMKMTSYAAFLVLYTRTGLLKSKVRPFLT